MSDSELTTLPPLEERALAQPFVRTRFLELAEKIAAAICAVDSRGYKQATISRLLVEFAEEIQQSAIEP